VDVPSSRHSSMSSSPRSSRMIWLWAARRTKINSSDPPLTAVCTAYATPPLLPFFQRPIELASFRTNWSSPRVRLTCINRPDKKNSVWCRQPTEGSPKRVLMMKRHWRRILMIATGSALIAGLLTLTTPSAHKGLSAAMSRRRLWWPGLPVAAPDASASHPHPFCDLSPGQAFVA
jgi:hypothetical protein